MMTYGSWKGGKFVPTKKKERKEPDFFCTRSGCGGPAYRKWGKLQ